MYINTFNSRKNYVLRTTQCVLKYFHCWNMSIISLKKSRTDYCDLVDYLKTESYGHDEKSKALTIWDNYARLVVFTNGRMC